MARYGVLTRADASLYLSYIYLRYEENPNKALYYAKRLHVRYPNNLFYRAKYAESLALEGNYSACAPLLDALFGSPLPYYRLGAFFMRGLIREKAKKQNLLAMQDYQRALDEAKKISYIGNFYKCASWAGLGRMHEAANNKRKAKDAYKAVLRETESDMLRQEAKQALKRLK